MPEGPAVEAYDYQQGWEADVPQQTEHLQELSMQASLRDQGILTTHIGQEFLDLAELLRLTDGGDVYSMRKKTIERALADAKEKHGLRYTHLRSLTRVLPWVRLKFTAMNLKELALCSGGAFALSFFYFFCPMRALFLTLSSSF